MVLEYKVKGVILDVVDIIEIHHYYEAFCTAEYITDNYVINDDVALKIGYEVREFMSDYNCSEEEAIEEILPKYGFSIHSN